ncbi:hypothetical protein NLI96_g8959 [Meripilus lineatus]|uniref:Inosine triphosphate pyrophosphatase n=1 Tax=Meripilus lineatus TaxID=2056292 RepID=A0AAD5V100_9APHY|nr:hypothetical protein NLI96_g8959 [Physisporinus lineatus]
MAPKLTFVTGNAMKLKEVRAILGEVGIEVVSQALDIPELQGTTQEIARDKCRRAADIIQGPCITEDTALCFDALDGLPGPYIKDFHTRLGLEGLNTLLEGFPDKTAWALCTFGYSAGPGTEPLLFEGRTKGKIVPPRGPSRFGWNPVFEESQSGKTFAEMTDDEKYSCSHRSRALELLKKFLDTLKSDA